jgi:hypothetical protein
MVVWGLTPADVLAGLGVTKDVEYTKALDSSVSWIHRRAGSTDIYFVVNRSDHPQEVNVRFRVNGKDAELWHADTGEMEPASYSTVDGRTTVPLRLSARESVFVVFRRPTTSPTRTVRPPSVNTLETIAGPWTISFPSNLGAPSSVQLAELASWTTNADNGVKYFSGSATYTKTFQASRSWLRPGTKLLLNLGTVNDLAEVSINGQVLGNLWKQPYEVEVTKALKPGNNKLEIRVTNQWTNRIIGDRLSPDNKVLADVPARPGFGPPPTLVPSGLLGPVTIVANQSVP